MVKLWPCYIEEHCDNLREVYPQKLLSVKKGNNRSWPNYRVTPWQHHATWSSEVFQLLVSNVQTAWDALGRAINILLCLLCFAGQLSISVV